MKWSIYASAALLFFAGAAVRAADKPEEKTSPAPSYTKDVQPFLAKFCVECHNAKVSKAGFNFDGFDALMKGGRKGKALVAGEPNKSTLVRVLTGKGKPMPPRKYKHQPKAADVDTLKAWIAAGAKDDTDKGEAEKSGAAAVEPRPFVRFSNAVTAAPDGSAHD